MGANSIDRYVLPVLDVLNRLPGVVTYASCNGHGYTAQAYVAMIVSDWDSLLAIERAIYCLRSNFTEDFDLRSQAWLLQFDCFATHARNNSLQVSIRYQDMGDEALYNGWMNTRLAWEVLLSSLVEATKQSYPVKRS